MGIKINRNLIFLVLAIILGIVASLMMVQYVNKQVLARTQPANKQEMRQVVVPVSDLEKGATLTQDAIAARSVPAEFVPADALTPDNYQDYLGQVLIAPLAHGAPI
jgi:pilus assembly protein CpaB